MPKVYDCFIFNGELDLLEIRLKTHWDKVDKFVIVEGNRSFQGKRKDYSLEFLQENLLPYASKMRIIFFDVPVFKEPDGPWLSMGLQRDNLIRGLFDCESNDFVIFSEADEILRPEKITEAMNLLCSEVDSVAFQQESFCYFLNVRDYLWTGPRMLKFKTVIDKRLSPQVIRNDECFSDSKSKRLLKSGWHFQNLGGVERVIRKMQSSCHRELGVTERSNYETVAMKIKNLIEPLERSDHKLRVVELNESYPECVYKNQRRYQHLIYKGGK